MSYSRENIAQTIEPPSVPRASFRVDFTKDLQQLFAARRDVRRFRLDPIPDGKVCELVEAACLAPSVGLSEPWRFVSVRNPTLRDQVCREFESQNQLASQGYDPIVLEKYLALKLAGLKEAPEHLAIFAQLNPVQGRGLGRQTMPETVEYSVVAAIQNLWLLARAHGIGVGWVSIVRPMAINQILGCPEDWKLIAYLCIGYPDGEDCFTPELQSFGWEQRKPVATKWIEL